MGLRYFAWRCGPYSIVWVAGGGIRPRFFAKAQGQIGNSAWQLGDLQANEKETALPEAASLLADWPDGLREFWDLVTRNLVPEWLREAELWARLDWCKQNDLIPMEVGL